MQPERVTPDSSRPALLVIWGVVAILCLWVSVATRMGWPAFPPCGFHALTGCYCPGCGGTRAVKALAVGEWSVAVEANVLAAVAVPLALLALLAMSAAPHATQAACARVLSSRVVNVGLGLLLVFWVARNLPGWPWELLRP